MSMSEVDDSREVHSMVCRDLQAADTRTFETKRNADDAHDQIRTHRDRCRRAVKEFETADLNDSLGRLGQLVKDTAGGHPRVSRTKPAVEALDLVEEFQRSGSGRGSTDIILVERQQ